MIPVMSLYCDFQESWRQTILQGRRFLRTWRRGQTLYWPAAALREVRVRWVTCQRWAAVLKSPAQDLRRAAQGPTNSQRNRVQPEEVVRTVKHQWGHVILTALYRSNSPDSEVRSLTSDRWNNSQKNWIGMKWTRLLHILLLSIIFKTSGFDLTSII